MTRGMFVTVLGRMAGVNPGNYAGPSTFTDVSENAYYAPYVAWAAKYGVTVGMGDGKFSPDAYINRQQMAAFFVRYFETFGVDYETGANITSNPADLDSVSSWARDAVLKLWRTGLLVGNGENFDPTGSATRAQTATICYRTDEAVATWYSEPGVPSTRVRIDPATGLPYDADAQPGEQPSASPGPGHISGGGGSVSGNSYSVGFYDGSRLIKRFSVKRNEPLGQVPTVAESSKANYILEGYYTDSNFTTPFYAEDPVTGNMNVYAKYESMGDAEALTLDSFARMDQQPDVSFRFKALDRTADTTVTGATTLYAKWTAKIVTVTFNTNGGVNLGAGEAEKAVMYGDTYGVLPTPERSGYGFRGWWSAADGGTQVTTDTTVTATEDHALYAHWVELKTIPETVFTFGVQETAAYDKNSHTAAYTFTPESGESYTEDSFTVTYTRVSDEFIGENKDAGAAPTMAGTYNVTITRAADDTYAKFDQTYTGVLVIERATRTVTTISADELSIYDSNIGMTYGKVSLSYNGGQALDLDESSEALKCGYQATSSLGTYKYTAEDGLIYDLAPGTDSSKCFKGTFGGDGHTISGLYSTTYGLFQAIGSGAVIQNVTLDDCYIGYKGGLIRTGIGGTTLKNCISNATINNSGASSSDRIVYTVLANFTDEGNTARPLPEKVS